MGEQPQRKPLKIGVRQGGGPPPGYKWTVRFFDEVNGECKLLNETQFAHVVEQVRHLARERDPSHPKTIDVRAIEDFHEYRDKGGVLCRINFRVYFYIDKQTRSIVVLGADKKEEDGQTSLAIKVRMRNRLRKYLNDTT